MIDFGKEKKSHFLVPKNKNNLADKLRKAPYLTNLIKVSLIEMFRCANSTEQDCIINFQIII